MNLLIFTGSHPRHLFLAAKIARHHPPSGVVCERREAMIPEPPPGIMDGDQENFVRHFRVRDEVERRVFGVADARALMAFPFLEVAESELNSPVTADFVSALEPDFVLIFGTGLIKEPVFSGLPDLKINMHLGLSPWYRGSATLFWPFYNLEPQSAGVTFHVITAAIDAGPVISQVTPPLHEGDGIHDVGARAVVEASEEALRIIDCFKTTGDLPLTQQRSAGRLYLDRAFQPAHLRVVYDLFDDRIVDRYLDGTLSGHQPKLITL